MPDRNRRQARQRRDDDVPVVHEAPPYQPPPSIARFASPAAFVPIGLLAGALLVAIAFAIRDTDEDSPAQVGPPGSTPTETAAAESPTPEGTPTPDSRSFEAAEEVIDAEAFDYRATIETASGSIVIDLFDDIAPNTVNSFVFLAQNGFYDDLRWHRVEPNFLVESGDPRTAPGREDSESLQNGPGYETQEEPNGLFNTRGRLSMLKDDGASTFGSQFFINLKDNPARDDAFYPFGEVVDGFDALDGIEPDDVITTITIEELPEDGEDPGEDDLG